MDDRARGLTNDPYDAERAAATEARLLDPPVGDERPSREEYADLADGAPRGRRRPVPGPYDDEGST
ncbi:MAG TPA: hypothetical protein VFZ00_28420 [Solirubrobacter sp.]|nr:hypothetical protein [Solirubrobacter sp.]